MTCNFICFTDPVQEIESVPETGYAPFFFAPASEGGSSLLFHFTSESFTRVLSALINGAQLTYGNEGTQVVWDFLQNVEYPVSFCSQLIECITNDADTRAALSNFIAEHPDGTTYEKNQPLPAGATAGNILPANPDCDPDILWSQCIGLVQTANRMVTDFLETWETYNNSGEVLSDVVQGIPGVSEVAGALGIPGMIEYANDLVDSISEGYAADYTLEYEQTLACQIFCAAKDDCVVSIDMLTGIMNTRISNALTLDNLTELLVSLIDQDISGFNVADLYLAFFFDALAVANLVVPITWGIEAYLTTIAVFNEPNDDWMVLCTDCAPDCTEYDFTVSDHGFTALLTDYAIYVPGEGWARGTGVNDGRCGLQAAIGNYTSVAFEYNMVADNPTSLAGLIEYPYPPYVQIGPYENTTGLTTFTITQTSSLGGLAFDLGTTESSSHLHPLPEGWRLTKIIVCR